MKKNRFLKLKKRSEKWAFFVLILVYFMSSGFKGCVIMKAKIPGPSLEIKRKIKNKPYKLKA